MDVVVSNGRRTIGFEIKTSSVPTVNKRFWVAIDDLKLDAAFVVAPIARPFRLKQGVDGIAQALAGL